MTRSKLVVIGNGMAGARTAEEILKRAPGRFDVTIIGSEPHGNYNRILLSNVLNGSQDARDIFLNPLDWYESNSVRLLHGAHATRIDREARQVLVAKEGSPEESRVLYDTLIIATGSRAFVPEVDGLRLEDGSPKPGVFSFRTLDDCQKIAGFATKCHRAVVVGGGLLGLEAARGLLNFGCEVHVVHIKEQLMEKQLDEVGGAMLRRTMEEMGVRVHLQKSTAQVLGGEAVSGVRFQDGSELACDMVLFSCGVRPNVELARGCGLPVERAIVVDDQMRTSDPSIFAVGECVQHRGSVYGLVAPLWEQGRVLADVVSGANAQAAYRGSKTSTKLKVMGCDLASMGEVRAVEERDEEVQFVEKRRGRYRKLVIRDGKLIGAILMGDTSRAGYLTGLFERGTPLPEEREHLLFDVGAPAKATALLDMPDSAQVCKCNAVSKGTLKACVLAGACSARDVMLSTRAGLGCGSCKPLVNELFDWVKSS